MDARRLLDRARPAALVGLALLGGCYDFDAFTRNFATSNGADGGGGEGGGGGDGAGPGHKLSFAPPHAYALAMGSHPWSIAAGDLDGSHGPDLVEVNQGDGTVGVLLDKGDGSFQPPTSFPSGQPTANGVAAGALERSGHLDLAIASDQELSVRINKGGASFGPPGPVDNTRRTYAVAIADLNRDGWGDVLATAPDDAALVVALGRGGGSFGSPTASSVGTTPSAVAVADLDGDGKLDAVTANNDSGDVSLLRGRGDGSFEAQVVRSSGGNADAVAVADLDGDGRPDLVIANAADMNVRVRLAGGGGFQFPDARSSTFGTGGQPSDVAIADFNGDGRLDIVAANVEGSLAVLLGAGGGSFQIASPLSLPTGAQGEAMAIADFNGDGKPDIAVAGGMGDVVVVFLNTSG